MLRRSGIAMAAFFLLTSMAWAQDNTYEISLGGSAVFSKQSTGNGTVLTPTNSGAVLVTGRYRFSEHSSVEINYSHTSNSQIYFSSPLTYRIQGTIAEYSGAYVFSFHESQEGRAVRFCRRGGSGFLSRLQFQHHQRCANLSSRIPANQAGFPLWRRIRLDSIFSSLPLIRRSSADQLTWRCGCSIAGWCTRRRISTCRTCLPAPGDTWRSLRWGSW